MARDHNTTHSAPSRTHPSIMPKTEKKARFLSPQQWLHVLVGLGGGVGLCVLLFHKISFDTNRLSDLLHRLSWGWSLLALLLTLALWWTGARKWEVWNKGEHTGSSAVFLRRHVAWQMWLGQFLPSSVAVIAGRSWAERHKPRGWKQGAKSGFYDQAFEFMILAGLLPASILILFFKTGPWLYLPLSFMGMAAAAGVIRLGFALFPRLLPEGQPPHLPALLYLSGLRVILIVGRALVFIPLFGFDLSYGIVIAASPLLALLFVVPLTPANLGISEWGWVGILSFAGYAPSEAALFALGSRSMILILQTLLLFLYEAGLGLKKIPPAPPSPLSP